LDHASLLVLQEQAGEYVRESKRRDALEPDELSRVVLSARSEKNPTAMRFLKARF
jgi:hypothetical protein